MCVREIGLGRGRKVEKRMEKWKGEKCKKNEARRKKTRKVKK